MNGHKRLYYFTDERHAVENVKMRRLKVSFANEVNDLFELSPFDFGSRKIRLAWKSCIDKNAETQGFVSFSEGWDVPTMWAHYANSHKGVCYGFDVSRKSLCRIRYVNDLRKFDKLALTDGVTNKREIDYASRTKSSYWKYEREWRQYVSLGKREAHQKACGEKLFFLEFSDEFSLREIIIGAQSELFSAQFREALSPYDKVTIRTARPSFREYKIVEQKNARLMR